MSRVAVHLDPLTQKVQGVWVVRQGQAVSYYPSGVEYPYQLGYDHVSSWSPEILTWDQMVDYLIARSPNRVWWESADSEQGETPEATFMRLTKK